MGGPMEWTRLRNRNRLYHRPNYFTNVAGVGSQFLDFSGADTQKLSMEYMAGEMDRYEGTITARWYHERVANKTGLTVEQVSSVIDAVLLDPSNVSPNIYEHDRRPSHWPRPFPWEELMLLSQEERDNIIRGKQPIPSIYNDDEHVHCFCYEGYYQEYDTDNRFIKYSYESCCDCLYQNVIATEDITERQQELEQRIAIELASRGTPNENV